MYTIVFVKFSDWLNQQFFLWRGNTKKSVTDFADFVGVSQQVMDKWMNPKLSVTPTIKTLVKLAEKYPEVYDVLDLPRPELSPLNARLLLAASKDLSRSVKDAGIDINDPAFEKLFIEIFSKHGINVEIMD